MIFLKKILYVLLISTIVATLFTVVTYADTGTVTINSMATSLNKLNILQGTNGNYLLNDKIDRSQAAALIIRMLGKENFVKQNTEQLKFTKYADVPAKDWYAPYVGYCTQYNIMGGYPDGRFAPKDYISEKSFLKMAMCALGYVYNVDFDWSNVYQKAFSTGIVKEQTYSAKIQDNSNYLRSDAVKVLYNTLNTYKKGTTTKMVYTLVDEGVFSRDIIAASGILGPDKQTEIDLITATNYNSIEINLNENVQNVNTSDVTITDSSSTSTQSGLTVQSVGVSNDKIQVITSGQTPNKNYTVKIRSVTDSAGNVTEQLTGTFKGFARSLIISDFFKIGKVDQVSSNVFNVYFTQPVNSNSETPIYYELLKNGSTVLTGSSQNMTVKKLASDKKAVSIYLKNSILSPGEVYTVRISGKLTSSYGTKLGEGYGESMEFVTTQTDSGSLTVSSVYAWSSTSVRIVFNREVDSSWAEKFLNYTVTDANKTAITVTKATKTGASEDGGRTVVLSLASPLEKTKQYEVKMEYIPDIYKQSAIEGKSYAFSGAYPENTSLSITKASSDYNNSVVILFSRALDPDTASKPSNYSIASQTDSSFSSTPIKAYYDDTFGTYAVKLYLPEGKTLNSSQRYVVYSFGLKDSSGLPQPAVLRTEFSGSSYSAVKPQIADAVTISKDAVKLTFSMEIAFDINNITTSNYTMEYVQNGDTVQIEPIAVLYVDSRTLVLRFDELDLSKSYQIRFKSINDFSGLYTRTSTEGGNTATVRQGK